jgi:hypothetical protein
LAVMSQRAYARHSGRAVSTVQEAVARGRIPTLPDGRIDSDVADAEWRKNTQIHQPPVTRRRQADVDDEDDPVAGQYIRARAARAHYEARLAKLQFEQLAGSIVPTEGIKMAQFQIDRRHRDCMLNLADRLSAPVAAEVREMLVAAGVPVEQAAIMDANRVHTIMSTQIRQALTDYADSLTDPAA